jgi:hypothetical protein
MKEVYLLQDEESNEVIGVFSSWAKANERRQECFQYYDIHDGLVIRKFFIDKA